MVARTRLAALALALPIAGAPAVAAADREVRASATVSPRAVLDYVTDGHGLSEKHALATGLDGEAVWRAHRRWRLGVGARTTAWWAGGAWLAQELDVVALGGAHVELARGDAVDVEAGVGWMAAAYPHEGSHTGAVLVSTGPAAELTVTYWHALGADLALGVGLGVRFARPEVQNGTDYFAGEAGVHAELPIRVGLRWR